MSSEEQHWEVAKNAIARLGSVPASFSSLIRKMRSDMQASPAVLSSVSIYELNRLLRGPALLTPLAYAALEFHPEKLTDVKNLSKAVIGAFSVEELCALIGTLYLTRQVKKRCNPEEWTFITEYLAPTTTLAGHLGLVISPFGFERSLCSVSFIILGMALFQGSSAKNYSLYRRDLKKTHRYFHIENELKYFDCSAREIGSLMSQSVALSSNLASEFLLGPEAEPGKRPASGIQALNLWLSSLAKSGTAPQEAMDAKWYPTKDKVELIEALARKVKDKRSPSESWILKEGSDLESLTPLLAKIGGGNAMEIAEEIEGGVDENVEPFDDNV